MPTNRESPSMYEMNAVSADPARKSRRLPWVITCLVLVAAVAGAWRLVAGDDQAPADQPLIVTVQRGDIENTIAAAGSLKPRNFVDVGAQVSGQLQKLYVEVGDRVEAGQLLAEIDARVQQNRVDASRASIESLEAQLAARRAELELARANARRQERLMAADATSQQDYDTAMTSLSSAESGLIQLQKQIQQNRASLASEETELEFTRIYAPTSGTVVTIEMNEGRTLNSVQQAPTILRIADLSTMTVETDVSEADIGDIRKGMDVYFTTLGGGERRWYGQLRQILPTPKVEENVVLYTGLFDVPNPDGMLLPEMTAQVYFVTASARDVLTVPMGALDFGNVRGAAGKGAPAGTGPQDGNPAAALTPPEALFPPRVLRPDAARDEPGPRQARVRVVREDGSIEERYIVIGVTSRVVAEVVSGLTEGEKVVAGIVQGGDAAGSGNGRSGPPGFRMGGF